MKTLLIKAYDNEYKIFVDDVWISSPEYSNIDTGKHWNNLESVLDFSTNVRNNLNFDLKFEDFRTEEYWKKFPN